MSDLDTRIQTLTESGYRLEMIFPADSPRVAELSRGDERIRIESDTAVGHDREWHVGRAGMEYRDLIPDRLDGRVIASHIRIRKGGPIPDYVHYHDVAFQMIYCLRGSALLVYQDQGPPFRFNSGDLVIQPPTIRHRVLECSDGFEVFEVGSPAEHPTFAEHEFGLPTERIDPDREFGGQRFLHHRRSEAIWDSGDGISRSETAVAAATRGAADVSVWQLSGSARCETQDAPGTSMIFVSEGSVEIESESNPTIDAGSGECIVLGPAAVIVNRGANLAEFVSVRIPAPVR